MSVTGSEVTARDLHAYFDGELDADARARVEAALETSAALRAELDSLNWLERGYAATMEAEAVGVPEARFEQIWDEIEQGIDRESRLQDAADAHGSPWARLLAWLRPARIPLALAGAAAAVALFVVARGADDVNPAPDIASVSKQAPPEAQPKPTPDTSMEGPAIEVAESLTLPAPESNDAEIKQIEFGTHVGRIEQIDNGKRGTTTVIWIAEEEPAQSERSL